MCIRKCIDYLSMCNSSAFSLYVEVLPHAFYTLVCKHRTNYAKTYKEAFWVILKSRLETLMILYGRRSCWQRHQLLSEHLEGKRYLSVSLKTHQVHNPAKYSHGLKIHQAVKYLCNITRQLLSRHTYKPNYTADVSAGRYFNSLVKLLPSSKQSVC